MCFRFKNIYNILAISSVKEICPRYIEDCSLAKITFENYIGVFYIFKKPN